MAIATEKFGFGKVVDFTTNPLAIYCAGQRRFDIGNATLTTEGAQSGALLFGLGTDTTHVATGTADKKFIAFYTKSTATSGDSRGLYLKHDLAGAGISGEAARIYSSVVDVVAVDVRGAHISLDFGSTGLVSGSGQALTTTLHIANQATQTGTLSCITAEIYSEGTTSDPAGASLSFIRCAMNGDTTGDDDVNTDAYLIDFSAVGASGATNFWYDHDGTAGGDTVGEWVKVKTPNGTRFIGLYDATH